MLWTPQKGATKVISNGGIVGAQPYGTAVPSSTAASVYGAVTEIISAANNTQDSWGIYVAITNTGLAATIAQGALDILIGGATDDVLIPALLCGYTLNTYSREFFFPLHIPGGVRIAARFASVRTSINAHLLLNLYGGSPPPFRAGRKVTAVGTRIDNARGQAVVPTASGGAASVTELDASSDEDYFAFLPGFQAATDTTLTPNGHVNIGIGVGAATEERIGTWWFGKDTNEGMQGPIPAFPVFRDVPAGTRLTVLASNSGANDAAYDGLIYAVS